MTKAINLIVLAIVVCVGVGIVYYVVQSGFLQSCWGNYWGMENNFLRWLINEAKPR